MTLFKGRYSGNILDRESSKLKIKISKSPRGENAQSKKRAFEINGEGSELIPQGGWEYDPEKKGQYGGNK